MYLSPNDSRQTMAKRSRHVHWTLWHGGDKLVCRRSATCDRWVLNSKLAGRAHHCGGQRTSSVALQIRDPTHQHKPAVRVFLALVLQRSPSGRVRMALENARALTGLDRRGLGEIKNPGAHRSLNRK